LPIQDRFTTEIRLHHDLHREIGGTSVAGPGTHSADDKSSFKKSHGASCRSWWTPRYRSVVVSEAWPRDNWI
jgi:hypothetical protein